MAMSTLLQDMLMAVLLYFLWREWGRGDEEKGDRRNKEEEENSNYLDFKSSHALWSIHARLKICDRFYRGNIGNPIERSHNIVRLCVCVCTCVCVCVCGWGGGGRGEVRHLYHYITGN